MSHEPSDLHRQEVDIEEAKRLANLKRLKEAREKLEQAALKSDS